MATLLTRVKKVLYQRTKRNREPLQPKFDGDWPLLFKISARGGGGEGPIRCNGGKRPTVVPPDGVTTPDDIHLDWCCCLFPLRPDSPASRHSPGPLDLSSSSILSLGFEHIHKPHKQRGHRGRGRRR